MDEVGVHPVGDDLPVRLEVSRVRVDHGLAHGQQRGVAVEPLLQGPAENPAQRRAGEPRMKCCDHRQTQVPGGLRRYQAQRRVQSAMHVHHVDALAPEQVAQLAPQTQAGGDPGERPRAVNGAAGADPVYEGRILFIHTGIGMRRLSHARRHHDRWMPLPLELQGEIMHMLGNPAEVGIVVLRNKCDPHALALQKEGARWKGKNTATRGAPPAMAKAPGRAQISRVAAVPARRSVPS